MIRGLCDTQFSPRYPGHFHVEGSAHLEVGRTQREKWPTPPAWPHTGSSDGAHTGLSPDSWLKRWAHTWPHPHLPRVELLELAWENRPST